jgi:hypothetical protein
MPQHFRAWPIDHVGTIENGSPIEGAVKAGLNVALPIDSQQSPPRGAK